VRRCLLLENRVVFGAKFPRLFVNNQHADGQAAAEAVEGVRRHL
jgi:hypothetical protein